MCETGPNPDLFARRRASPGRRVGKVSVDRAHGNRSFANGTGDTLDRPETDVAGCENPGRTCLKRQRCPLSRPCRLRNVAAGKDEPALVELHNIAKPIGVRFRANEHEHGCCKDFLLSTRAEIL